MKKRIVIITEIILIIATVLPVIALLWECINAAIHGTIPWGFGYGVDYNEFIYGMEAFIYTLSFYFAFLFIPVILWFTMFVFTIGFTIFTVVYLARKPV